MGWRVKEWEMGPREGEDKEGEIFLERKELMA